MFSGSKNNRGFTLIEMLIVVLILGIFALTILPSIATNNTEVKEAVLKTNLKNLRNAIERYH